MTRIQDHLETWLRRAAPRCLLGVVLAASMLHATQASAQNPQTRKKPIVPASHAHGPDAVSQDFGDVAVVVDNGVIVTPRNPFDLGGTTVRFEPAGEHSYSVASSVAVLDSDYGPALTFGFSGATRYPGDDDTQEIAFAAGFPFFGATYASVWVNTDGNLTFGEPDFASADRDKARHVLGAPRVAAYLHDWNPFNALNPFGSGTIHAAVKSNPDRLVATWNGVADFEGGLASTFQTTLYSTGAVEITFAALDPASTFGVVGIAEGGGKGPLQSLDLGSIDQTLPAGALLEAFGDFARVNEQEVTREFYKTHPDKFDYLVILSDFPVDFLIHHTQISNQTHGIGTPLLNGTAEHESTVFDRSTEYGSAGELEEMLFLNNISLYPTNPTALVAPAVEPYSPNANLLDAPDLFGLPVTLDGQTMSQFRVTGVLPPDDGEIRRFFPHSGPYSMWLASAMSMLAHEVEHRWGAYVRFVHPTKGAAFESFDLLGLDTQHWSYFVNSAVPSSQFPGAPRASMNLGNHIQDLGGISSYNGTPVSLAPGESVFLTPATQLIDGYSALDQYLMGLRRANEVGPFFYVDEPRSVFTGQTLDGFDPVDPLNTAVTMRAWNSQGGIVFQGKRVNLTVENIKEFEKLREKGANPQGKRFWGKKGNLGVRYFSNTGQVDPGGNATIVLSESDRELGDEADLIDSTGRPVDVKTMAFVLLVQDGPPSSHSAAVGLVDSLRKVWEQYINGPATGGRGKFDTRLDPGIY
jgi:hypothetical protein